MRIRRVKWKDHPVLGSLELDFINTASGQPFRTVIFAGENGAGKTTVLEDLSSFLNLGSFAMFEYIEYTVNGSVYKAIPTSDDTTYPTYQQNFFDVINPDGTTQRVRSDKTNNPAQIRENPLDLRHYGCVFSKARSDYKTQKITSTSTSKLDSEKYDTDTNDDFTSLKQLIVDVVNQDNADYMEMNKLLGATPQPWPDYYPTSRVYRFKSSFDTFFEGLAYDRVKDEAGEKSIVFTKNGKPVPIDKLSTGEKQIVFRGIYLLKNSGILDNAAVMIDEPELSMHPKWQEKILQYYMGLFSSVDGTQKAQLFFATHSDHVLKHALADKANNLVIVLEREGDNIRTKRIDSPSVLPSITSAETNFLAFDLISNDYHIELYGWLQDKESKSTVKSCDDYIVAQRQYDPALHARPSRFGCTHYRSLPTYIRNVIHHPSPRNTFTHAELRTSISLLIDLLK
jgi:predicted ATP-binding protein involved in virulence